MDMNNGYYRMRFSRGFTDSFRRFPATIYGFREACGWKSTAQFVSSPEVV
jgi:hypothetical protein